MCVCDAGMRRDLKILDVMAKTRRQERETACCIRNDDSGCVQSSQADCSVRGLWPTVCVFNHLFTLRKRRNKVNSRLIIIF